MTQTPATPYAGRRAVAIPANPRFPVCSCGDAYALHNTQFSAVRPRGCRECGCAVYAPVIAEAPPVDPHAAHRGITGFDAIYAACTACYDKRVTAMRKRGDVDFLGKAAWDVLLTSEEQPGDGGPQRRHWQHGERHMAVEKHRATAEWPRRETGTSPDGLFG